MGIGGTFSDGKRLKPALYVLGVCLICFLAARFSRYFLVLPEAVSVFRPQTALLAGVLLLRPRREWLRYSLAAFIGFFLAELGGHPSIYLPLVYSALPTAAAILTCLVLQAIYHTVNLEKLSHILALVLVPSPLVFAPAAALAWVLASRDPFGKSMVGSFFPFFRLWSMSEAMASILILPIMIGLPRTIKTLREMSAKRMGEVVALTFLTLGLALPWFLALPPNALVLATVLLAPYAVVLWGATRFNVAGNSLVCLGIFGLAVVATSLGKGPMVPISANLEERIVLVHADAMLVATISLFFASANLKRTQAQQALREGERRLRFIIESILDVIFVFDPKGKVIFVSPPVLRLTGYPPHRLVGKRIDWLVHRDDREKVRESFARVARSPGTIESAVFRIRGNQPLWRIAEAVGLNLVADSAVGGILVTVRDVTSRFKAEEELREAKEAAEKARATAERAQEIAEEALEVKSVFLSNVSHEIRTPLTGILGMTSLLSDSQLTRKQRLYAERLKESGALLLAIVNDILDLEKIESGARKPRLEAIEIGKLCLEILGTFEAMAAAKDIALECSGETAGFRAETDPQMLSQILANLIGNAVKYTDRGFVRVSWAVRQTLGNRGEMTIEVEDTGIGISQDDLGVIFERFRQLDSSYSKKYKGTGLGLHIVRRLTDLLAGSITVRSQVGKGSVFTVRIPCRILAAETAVKDRAGVKRAPLVRCGGTVVVAEDNSINRLFIRTVLEEAGCAVEAATNGNEVLSILKRRTPDLIVMDVQMPHMDGIECTKRIRNAADPKVRAIPILALTGYALGAERERCLEAGMDAYLAKPFDEFELMAAVDRSLARRRLEREG